jgi:hypothetical protein
VSGLFGTFKMKMTLIRDARRQTRRTCHRNDVKVFNAALASKTKTLTIRSLRMLALALPEQYPFPSRNDIPSTHVTGSDDEYGESMNHRPKEGNKSRRGSAARAPTVGRPRSARKRPVRNTAEHSSDDDDSNSEDTESSRNSSAESHSNSQESDESEFDADQDDAAYVPRPDVPMLMAPSVAVQLDTVVALNMANDPEYLWLKYPIALVYICSLDPLKGYWFHLRETQFAPSLSRTRPREFKTSNKFLTFQKYWTNQNWWTELKKKTKVDKPTEEQVLSHWYKDNVHVNWILPVPIPQPAAHKVRMTDSFRINMDYVIATLIPACVHACCMHE